MVYIAMRLKSLCLSFQVLYVCRNVKDAVVSYFHHESLMKSHDLRCDFITYARYFPLWKKKLNDFLILYVLSITLYCIFCDILLHQGDLSTRPVLARWVFWDAGVWMEAKKSPKHDVLLVRKVLHRFEEQCVTLKVWGAKAGSRGHVEEDRRLHRLWLDRRGYSGSCSLQWTSVRLDFFTWQWQS